MNRGMLSIALIASGLWLGPAAMAEVPQITGRWLVEKKDGIIEIYQCGDRLCGKLVWMKDPNRDGAPSVDRNNPDPALRQRPLCGMELLGSFRQVEPQRWEDGRIYDPESGKTYHATMFLESATVLQLRGYVGIPLLGETQTWTRAEAAPSSC
jgi:uncharacterized protein (DUF2147 family)